MDTRWWDAFEQIVAISVAAFVAYRLVQGSEAAWARLRRRFSRQDSAHPKGDQPGGRGRPQP